MFKNVRLGTKLIAGFIVVILFSVIISIVGIYGTSKINLMLDNMYDNNLVPISDLANANMQGIYHNRAIYCYVIETEKSEMDKIKEKMNAYEKTMKDYLDKYRKAKLTETETNLLGKFDSAWSVYKQSAENAMSLSYEGKNKEAMEAMNNEVAKNFQVADDALSEIVNFNQDEGKKTYDASNQIYARVKTLDIVALVLCVVVSLTIGIYISIKTGRQITRVATNLKASSEQTLVASNQVSQSGQKMAEGASEQASSLEEISSSLEEMSSMTRQNADNTKQANIMSNKASQSAEKGKDAMTKMSQAIEKIKSSSDQTAKIIKTIDEIAFQTNLLALNAAVEAARAGDAGKGFAVVAEEVRNLAQRSADAAKNTSSLIEESQKNAENGVNVSQEVGNILKEIVETVQKVAQLIGEVSSAGNEQAQGIDQINTAVSQMDKVTQSNAANAEESASASEELSAQAKELGDTVNLLVAMISGNSKNGNEMKQSSVQHTEHHLIQQGEKESQRSKVSHILHNRPTAKHPIEHHIIAKSATTANDKKAHNIVSQRIVKPEDVIPLKDEDLKDF